MRVQMNGEVLSDDWGRIYDYFEIPCISPRKVRQALLDNPAGEELVLEINSPGGESFAGFEIYSVLAEADCRTRAEVQSLAASAASVLMLGCDEVAASPVAQVMIHLPWMSTQGDRYEHLGSVELLDSVADSILNAYVIKAGSKATRQELRSLMRTSTWLTAPEAKGLGLVDRILGEETLDPSAVLNCCGGLDHGIRALASAAPRDRQALLDSYRQAVNRGDAAELPALGLLREAGAGPAQQEPENAAGTQHGAESELQAAMARLELEKIRFGGAV